MKYLFNGEIVDKENFENEICSTANFYAERNFNASLDYDFGYFSMGDYLFSASKILLMCDYELYQQWKDDFASKKVEEIKWELEHTGEAFVDVDSFEIKEED